MLKFNSVKIVFSFFFLFYTSCVCAQQVDLFSSLQKDARTLYAVRGEPKEHTLYLSAPIKINGNWKFSRKEKLNAVAYSRTLEFADDPDFEELHSRVTKILNDSKARLLYSCSGLDCGSSNAWANVVFEVRQLYGLDPTQYYSVWEMVSANKTQYAVLYLSLRGNKRVYLQVQIVTPASSSVPLLTSDPKTILSVIEQTGYYVVPGDLQNLESNPHIQQIALALKLKPFMKIAVVAHAKVHGEFAENLSTSQHLAESVMQRLVDEGLSENRIIAHGVGAFAPEVNSNGLRVVLVAQ